MSEIPEINNVSKETLNPEDIEFFNSIPEGLQIYPNTPSQTFSKLERLGYFSIVHVKLTGSKYYQKKNEDSH